LSDRELEVLRLIAEGQSNAAIAERLVLSEKTVKGHVSNILGKLHLANRTQAAVFAWREGVVRPP
jgi:NarL family two-component system response regulator LiaR